MNAINQIALALVDRTIVSIVDSTGDREFGEAFIVKTSDGESFEITSEHRGVESSALTITRIED